jgi:hypothetical protein
MWKPERITGKKVSRPMEYGFKGIGKVRFVPFGYLVVFGETEEL